jgi:hypothetical protein
MPTLDVGPNEVHHISEHKLHELQDLKWGRLKSQEQAHYLRAAEFVLALFSNEATNSSNKARGARRRPLPVTGGATSAPPLPGAVLEADTRSTEHLLQLFRAFVNSNATQWKLGANHHHPIWQDIATELDMYDLNFEPKNGPDYAFIQLENRKPYPQLLAEYIDMHNEREATERGG